MKFEMAATLALAAGSSAFVAPSVPLNTRVAPSSASSKTSMMAGERSKSLPMLPQPPLVRRAITEGLKTEADMYDVFDDLGTMLRV
ncbi:unnamed protein product [Ectocarpus sp. CCAP 1310/34]|nr:unnamed protein product [Ectocarpus sp. CCAP 1310/34]